MWNSSGTQHQPYDGYFKRSLLCVDVILWFIGIVFITVGGAVLQVNHVYHSSPSYFSAHLLLVVVLSLTAGSLMLAVSLIGGKGVVNKSYNFIKAFIILATCTLFLVILIGALCIAYKNDVSVVVETSLRRAVPKYNTSAKAMFFLDKIHWNLKCCGMNGPHEFVNVTCGDSNGPPSCHVDYTCHGELFTRGCKTPLVKLVQDYYQCAIILAVLAGTLQIISIFLSCHMLKKLDDHEQYRVV